MVERPRETFQNDFWRADRTIWEAKFWSLEAWKGASWKEEDIVLRAASWTRPEQAGVLLAPSPAGRDHVLSLFLPQLPHLSGDNFIGSIK